MTTLRVEDGTRRGASSKYDLWHRNVIGRGYSCDEGRLRTSGSIFNIRTYLASKVWVSVIAFQARTNRMVILDETLGVRTTITRIAALSVDTGFVRRTVVVCSAARWRWDNDCGVKTQFRRFVGYVRWNYCVNIAKFKSNLVCIRRLRQAPILRSTYMSLSWPVRCLGRRTRRCLSRVWSRDTDLRTSLRYTPGDWRSRRRSCIPVRRTAVVVNVRSKCSGLPSGSSPDTCTSRRGSSGSRRRSRRTVGCAVPCTDWCKVGRSTCGLTDSPHRTCTRSSRILWTDFRSNLPDIDTRPGDCRRNI